MRNLIACLLLCASGLPAQFVSSHSGWNFDDTIQTATDVLVADILKGTRTFTGPNTVISLNIRVVRVLEGTISPYTELQLSGETQSFGPPPTSMQVAPTRALFFLRKRESTFEALRADSAPVPDSIYLALPSTPLPPGLVWLPDQHPRIKLANELAAAVIDLLARHPDLKSTPEARRQFDSLSMAMQQVPSRYSSPAHYFLATQLDPTVRLLGLQGRLNAGDVSAVNEIEQDLARLSTAYTSVLSHAGNSVQWRQHLPELHAYARIPLSDTPIDNWERQLPTFLGTSQSLEMLPYLRVMLDAPRDDQRDIVAVQFCHLLRGLQPGKATRFWDERTMSPNCPNATPIRDPNVEERVIMFWKKWYDEHLEDLRKAATLPQVIAPARYTINREPDVVRVPASMEVRFLSVVSSMSMAPTHGHAADGSLTPAPKRPEFYGRTLDPGDREIFHRIVDQVKAQLDEVQKAALLVIAQYSQTGQRPDPPRMQEFTARRNDALKAGLTQLQSQMSSKGWNALEKEMLAMNINAAALPLPVRK